MAAKVLIIGNSGFLGSYLASSLADGSFNVDSVGRHQVDFTKPIPLDFQNRLHDYDYAVICSAMTDIEKCFLQQEESQQVNVVGTIQLLQILNDHRLTPIFFSSDYVFKPSESAHDEEDERLPQTFYGQQKLAVEEHIERNFERFLIFRTNKLMSQTSYAKNILFQVIRNLANGIETKCFEDQWLNPVFVEDIATVLKLCCQNGLSGSFHLGTRQVLTRFELGQLLAEKLGYNPNLIQALSMRDITFSEPRPAYNVLNCRKIEAALNFQFTEVIDAIDRIRPLK